MYVLGHLIGRASPGWLMNIHEVTGGEVEAFRNAVSHSTPGASCVAWSSVLCHSRELTSKGSHLKFIPMASAHSRFGYPTSSGRNMVYYTAYTYMWILRRLYGWMLCTMSLLVCSHPFYILLGFWPFLHMLVVVLEGVWFRCG